MTHAALTLLVQQRYCLTVSQTEARRGIIVEVYSGAHSKAYQHAAYRRVDMGYSYYSFQSVKWHLDSSYLTGALNYNTDN